MKEPVLDRELSSAPQPFSTFVDGSTSHIHIQALYMNRIWQYQEPGGKAMRRDDSFIVSLLILSLDLFPSYSCYRVSRSVSNAAWAICRVIRVWAESHPLLPWEDSPMSFFNEHWKCSLKNTRHKTKNTTFQVDLIFSNPKVCEVCNICVGQSDDSLHQGLCQLSQNCGRRHFLLIYFLWKC